MSLYSQLIAKQPLLWTPALPPTPAASAAAGPGGAQGGAMGADAPALPGHGGRWLAPRGALLADDACMKGSGLSGPLTGAAAAQLLVQQLLEAGLPQVAALAPLSAKDAARLRAQMGWSVPGLPEGVAACLLALMPGAKRVDPAAARQQLAASSAAAGQRPRLQLPPARPWVEAPAAGAAASSKATLPPLAAVAVLLEYCLSDLELGGQAAARQLPGSQGGGSALSERDQRLLRQLHGLQLLPAADGSVQCLHVSALRAGGGGADAAAPVFVAGSEGEAALVADARPHMLLHTGLAPELTARLLVLAEAGGALSCLQLCVRVCTSQQCGGCALRAHAAALLCFAAGRQPLPAALACM